MTLEATLASTEDPEKVLGAVRSILGEAPCTVEKGSGLIRVKTSDSGSLDGLRDQLRDRHVRAAARRRFMAGREGERTVVMINRQAAAAGVTALCDSPEESPMGPLILTLESERLDELIEWLTGY